MPMPEPDTPAPQDRIEPVADWEQLRFRDDATPRARAEVPWWRSRQVWRWTAVAVLALLLLLIGLRQPLANLFWPDTRIQQLLDQGERALRQGQLSAADGSGARQYFEAALALDSDRTEAGQGLARVGAAALVQAQAHIQHGRIEQARTALALARELQVPRAQADRVAEALRAREAGQGSIDSWLAQAAQAQAAGRLDGTPDAALPLYQRVLQVQPTRLQALEGREDALSDLLQQAQVQLQRGDLAEAGEIIARVRGYDPGHVDLPATQAALARATERVLTQAGNDLRRRRLDAARTGYEAVLSTAPDDVQARQGLDRTAAAYAEQARRLAADFQFAGAENALQQARTLAPQLPAIAEAEQALARARQSEASLDSTLGPRQRRQRLERLLSGMAQAEARGDWITPPGESAYDQLRAAQALAPDDARVKRAAGRLLPAVQSCFEDEWRGNRVRRAQACLSAWQTLRPADAGLPEARRRMAQKWIAIGDERLGAGDVAFASQALAEARALSPRAPGLDEFAERVRMAAATPR